MVRYPRDGKCRYCKELATHGTLCEKHRNQQREADNRRCNEAAAANLCRMCKKSPADQGMRSCQPCRNNEARTQKLRTIAKAEKRAQARIAANVCVCCATRVPLPSDTLCLACRTRADNPGVPDKEICAITKRCTACSNQAVEGRKQCQECIDKRKAKRDRAVSAGLCSECNVRPKLPNRGRCQHCVDNRAAKYAQRTAARKCVRCSKDLPPDCKIKTCETCTPIYRATWRRKHRRMKDAAFNAYGGYKCKCCGETEELFLTIDHINNDGAAHRRSICGYNSGGVLYRWLKQNNYPEGFQVLCFNCNVAKHRNGYCPHAVKKAAEVIDWTPDLTATMTFC